MRWSVLAFALFAVACKPQPRVFASPAAPAAGVKGKRIAIRVSHEGRTKKNAPLGDFDPEMIAALRTQIESSGIEVRRDTSADEAVLDVHVLFDSPEEMIGDRAVFRYYLAKAGRATTMHSFEEDSIAMADITGALPRAAAVRITNDLVTTNDMVDIIKRFANAALNTTEPVPAGTRSVLALSLRPNGEVPGETITAASRELNVKLAARNIFKVVTTQELAQGSSAERDIERCTTVTCTAQIGSNLGVRYVGYGTIAANPTQYTITYLTVDTASAHVITRITRAVPRDDAKLMGAIEGYAGDIASQWASSTNVR